MSTAKQKPSTAQTIEATITLAYALGELKYAVIGGGACTMLGSIRETKDVDFVVPRNGTKNAKELLKQRPDHFEIDKKTLHTSFRSNPKVEIEILPLPLSSKRSTQSQRPQS